MRRIVPALLALSLVAGCATAPQPMAPSAKERLADELLSIVPPAVMFGELAEPHAAKYGPAHLRDKAHANFMRNVDEAALADIIRGALVRRFSEEELRALLTFCSTPEGRSCLTKVAPFAAEVLPACMHEAARAYGKTAVDASRGLLRP